MVTLKERLILLLRIESVSPVFGPTNYPTQPDCANQPQKQRVGVAVATENASRLTADVPHDTRSACLWWPKAVITETDIVVRYEI